MAGGRRALLSDDDDEEEDVGPQLGYNEKYAQRFKHNKEREDLHRFQELKKKGLAGDDESSSSSEDEDEDGLLPVRTDQEIYDTLAKIKSKHPSIYSEETRFFDDGHEEEEEAVHVKKQKPLYLKDVNARQLLDGTMEEETRKPTKPAPSYHSEQDELKRAFLQSVRQAEGEEEVDGDLLRVKKRSQEELEREAREAEEAVGEAEQRAKDKGIEQRLEEYFGKDNDLDDEEKFLKGFFRNKGWIDREQQSKYPSYNDDHVEDEDISEDELALEEQDRFEKDYNFRFQEGDNNYVQGHSRIIDDSVRKKPEARKKQRENKKERESEEERSRREELKRLKNLKKKEVLEKLSKIRAVAGVNFIDHPGTQVLGEEDLDEDFDPDEYDKKMKEAFGEEYYGAEDPDFVDDENSDDVQKPNFDIEDDLLGLAAGADPSAGFAATRARLDPSSSADNSEAKKKKKKKIKVPFEEKLLIDKHLEEYYKLDYEDVIGDLPTRFRYRPVKPNKYGLKTKDILALDDKDLNQFVSLKKLAPYTTEEWEARRPAPRLSSKERRKRAVNSEDTSRKTKKKKTAEAENTEGTLNGEKENSEDTRRKKKKIPEAGRTESTLNGGKANSEDHLAEDGGDAKGGVEGDGSAGKEKAKKKSRKRKKASAPSLLPLSRLLSYAPPASRKTSERARKKRIVTR